MGNDTKAMRSGRSRPSDKGGARSQKQNFRPFGLHFGLNIRGRGGGGGAGPKGTFPQPLEAYNSAFSLSFI